MACMSQPARWVRKGAVGPTVIVGLVLVLVGLMAGCSSTAPMLQRPSVEAARLPILVTSTGVDPHSQAVVNAVRSRLARAGYTVVMAPNQYHEVVARVSLSLTQDKTLFAVRVNGRIRESYTAHARLDLTGRQQLLGSAMLDFDADDTVTEQLVAPLTAAVDVRTLSAYAVWATNQRLVAQRAAAVEQQRRQQAAAAQARRDEEEAWTKAAPIACASPTKLDSCAAVQRYLARYPNGQHAAEARTTLEKGKPGLENLQKDEDYWTSKSGRQPCKDIRSVSACEGVELYVTKYPAGLHADEARQLLEAVIEPASEVEQ